MFSTNLGQTLLLHYFTDNGHQVCVCVSGWVVLVGGGEGERGDESSPASPFTCFIAVVTSILDSPEDARQAGLADAVLPEENHLVHLGLGLAAGGDHGVGGVRGAAAPVLLGRGVGRAAQEVGQLVGLSGLGHRGAQVPVVHGHAPPVQVGQIHGERHASSPLVHVPQLVTLVQSHCAPSGDLWTHVPCVNVGSPSSMASKRRVSVSVQWRSKR